MDLASYADLAVRLVNSAGSGPAASDRLATPEAYWTLVEDHPHLTGRVTTSDLEILRLLRTELQLVFAAAARTDDAEAAQHLNALLARHPIHQQLSRHDGQPWHLHLVESGSPADQYAAGAVAGLTGLVSGSGMAMLRTCARGNCGRVFLGIAAGEDGHFCSEACAPPANVRRLRVNGHGRGKGTASTTTTAAS